MLRWEEISPVLDATYRLLDERGDGVTNDDVEALLPGMEPEQVRHALGVLVEQNYIGAYRAFGGKYDSIAPRERGLQAAMGWPQPGSSDPADTELLLRILDDRIAAAGDEEERTRFQKLRDTAAETGGNIVSEVLAAYLARVTGASS